MPVTASQALLPLGKVLEISQRASPSYGKYCFIYEHRHPVTRCISDKALTPPAHRALQTLAREHHSTSCRELQLITKTALNIDRFHYWLAINPEQTIWRRHLLPSLMTQVLFLESKVDGRNWLCRVVLQYAWEGQKTQVCGVGPLHPP